MLRFATHVVVGACLFALVLLVAAALHVLAEWLQANDFAPDFVVQTVKIIEMIIYVVDIALMAILFGAEAFKLARMAFDGARDGE